MHLPLKTKMKSTVFDITSEVLTFPIILLIPVLNKIISQCKSQKNCIYISMYETFRKKKLLQILLKTSYTYRRNDINQSAKLPFCKKEFTNVQGFLQEKKRLFRFFLHSWVFFRLKLCVLSPNSNQTFMNFLSKSVCSYMISKAKLFLKAMCFIIIFTYLGT